MLLRNASTTDRPSLLEFTQISVNPSLLPGNQPFLNDDPSFPVVGKSIPNADPSHLNDHRVMYEWQTATGQTPADWIVQPSTIAARASFSGFTPGTWVNARARIRVPAGAGD